MQRDSINIKYKEAINQLTTQYKKSNFVSFILFYIIAMKEERYILNHHHKGVGSKILNLKIKNTDIYISL